jgi:hypothetical protein
LSAVRRSHRHGDSTDSSGTVQAASFDAISSLAVRRSGEIARSELAPDCRASSTSVED